MQDRRYRPGDVLDDYCPRERRITDHAIVAMIDDEIRRTRCGICDAEHEYKEGKVPAPRRRDAAARLVHPGARQHERTHASRSRRRHRRRRHVSDQTSGGRCCEPCRCRAPRTCRSRRPPADPSAATRDREPRTPRRTGDDRRRIARGRLPSIADTRARSRGPTGRRRRRARCHGIHDSIPATIDATTTAAQRRRAEQVPRRTPASRWRAGGSQDNLGPMRLPRSRQQARQGQGRGQGQGQRTGARRRTPARRQEESLMADFTGKLD